MKNIFNKQKKFEEAVLSGEIEYSSYYKDSFKRLKKNKMSMFCLVIIVLLVLIAIFAPLLAPYDPNVQDYTSILQAPSKAHWLGTDEYGRDLLSRIIYGTRISLSVGIPGSGDRHSDRSYPGRSGSLLRRMGGYRDFPYYGNFCGIPGPDLCDGYYVRSGTWY